MLFLGVHALESYILTPIIQRQALDIPPATLFAFQILLGVVFGIWGLALALPLMAIAKVMIDHFKADEAGRRRRPEAASALISLPRSPPSRCARPRAARQNTARPARAMP